MICVDDFSRFNIVQFLKKSFATAALSKIIAEHITHAGLKIGSIRTDEGGESKGEFQAVLETYDITHEYTRPGTPRYSGVAERAFVFLG